MADGMYPPTKAAPSWAATIANMTPAELAELNRPAAPAPAKLPAGLESLQPFVDQRVKEFAPEKPAVAPMDPFPKVSEALRAKGNEYQLQRIADMTPAEYNAMGRAVESGKMTVNDVLNMLPEPKAQRRVPAPVMAPSGFGEGAGGYYGPDYVTNLLRAREAGQISEKQFDAGVMQYNRAMTGTSAGLELQAGREQAALQQRAGMLDFDTAQKMAEAQAKENEALALTMQQDEERAAAFQERQQQFLRDAERRQNEMDALTAELRASKVDPNQYWKNRNGFSTMLSLFSVGLGGYLEGKTGGRIQNKALGMVENAINRDIEAQKANIDIKGQTLNQMRGAYGVARQRLGDEKAAEDYSRAILWDQFANIAKRYKGEARTSELANAADKIQMQAQAISRTFENQAKVAFARADEARRAAAAAAAAGAPERQLKLLERQAALRKTLAEAGKLEGESGLPTAEGFFKIDPAKGSFIPGLGFVAAPPDKAEKVRSAATSTQEVGRLADQLIALYNEPGSMPNIKASADFDKREQLVSALALALKGPGFAELGVLAGPDMKVLNDLIGVGEGANFWSRTSTVTKNLQRVKNIVSQKFQSVAEQFPIVQGEAQFVGTTPYFRPSASGATSTRIQEGPPKGVRK